MRTIALAALAFAFAPMLAPSADAHIPRHAQHLSVKAVLKLQERSYRHAMYVCRRGSGEPKRWHCAWLKPLRRELAETRAKLVPVTPAAAICAVFGGYCSQAISVARCESGLSVSASNGQYLGLFQMGSYARSRYGHSYTAYGQARAAYGYFRDTGYSWAPWECKP